MGDWYIEDDWYYPRKAPKKVVAGLKTKKERGTIGETWWSKRWLKALESLGMGSRLQRGRSYARQGQVVSIDIKVGIVKAKVQGTLSQPYRIEIHLAPFSDQQWEQVTGVMATQAIFAAKLLAGEMPTEIETAFEIADLSLFPRAKNDLQTSCSCPDWANPCKHIAAVYYILAEQFDADPFLLFLLRGWAKEHVIASLRSLRLASLTDDEAVSPVANEAASDEKSPAASPLRLAEQIDSFWQAGASLETFVTNVQVAAADDALLLKRLGNAPFHIKKQNLALHLAHVYDDIRDAVDSAREDWQL